MDRKEGKTDKDKVEEVLDEGAGAGPSISTNVSRTSGTAEISRQSTEIIQGQSTEFERQNEISRTQVVMSRFSGLRTQLENGYENVRDSITDTFNPGKLWEKFNSYSIWGRVGIFILIVALIGLFGWMSWHMISYMWRHLTGFLGSDHGINFVKAISTSMQSVRSSTQMESFQKQFEDVKKDKDKDLEVGSSTKKNPWVNSIFNVGFPCLSSFIEHFFTYVQNNAKEKVEEKAKDKLKKSKSKEKPKEEAKEKKEEAKDKKEEAKDKKGAKEKKEDKEKSTEKEKEEAK